MSNLNSCSLKVKVSKGCRQSECALSSPLVTGVNGLLAGSNGGGRIRPVLSGSG